MAIAYYQEVAINKLGVKPRFGATRMGYLRTYEWDSRINGFNDAPFVLRLACDGIHGMVFTPCRDFKANSFFDCVAMAKAEGWVIEKGLEPQDGQEIGCAYCPQCADNYELDEVVGETF